MKEIWSFRSAMKRAAQAVVKEYYNVTPATITIAHMDTWRQGSNNPTVSNVIAGREVVKSRVVALTGPSDKEKTMTFAYGGTVRFTFILSTLLL